MLQDEPRLLTKAWHGPCVYGETSVGQDLSTAVLRFFGSVPNTAGARRSRLLTGGSPSSSVHHVQLVAGGLTGVRSFKRGPQGQSRRNPATQNHGPDSEFDLGRDARLRRFFTSSSSQGVLETGPFFRLELDDVERAAGPESGSIEVEEARREEEEWGACWQSTFVKVGAE